MNDPKIKELNIEHDFEIKIKSCQNGYELEWLEELSDVPVLRRQRLVFETDENPQQNIELMLNDVLSHFGEYDYVVDLKKKED